jgi:hypothetical protein
MSDGELAVTLNLAWQVVFVLWMLTVEVRLYMRNRDSDMRSVHMFARAVRDEIQKQKR